MPKVQVVSQIDLNEVLESVVQLDLQELEQFALQLNRVLARRKAPSLSQRETELLQQINQGLPAPIRQRYRQLNDKVHDETLTTEEHIEFLTLVDQVELADAQRLKHLIGLAQLRGISLDDLLDQLGIAPSAYA